MWNGDRHFAGRYRESRGPCATTRSDHDGVTSHMTEARIDTTQERPQGTAADRSDISHFGKHRGGAASTEDSMSPAHGRHRRPAEGEHSNAA